MDAPGDAKPDCLIAAMIANKVRALYQAAGNAAMAQRFGGFDWKTEEDAFNDGFRMAGRPGAGPIDSQGDDTGYMATYAAAAQSGQQRRAVANQGSEGRQADRHADALHRPSSAPRTARRSSSRRPGQDCRSRSRTQKAKHKYWINNGRNNEIWQTAYHNQYDRVRARADTRWRTSS